MKRAIEITEDSIASTFDRLQPGMRDRDVAKIVAEEHAKRGLDGGGLVQFGPQSALPHGGTIGTKLAPQMIVLIDAGGDTTRNLVGGGLVALFDHPDERRRLQDDLDGVLPTAVDEMLRWVSPVVYMRRTATDDCELAGTAIAAGDKVVMYYGSANRDERAFSDPDHFDVGRTPNEHIAFGGGGPHF